MQNEDKTAMDYSTLKMGNIHYSGPFYKEQVAMEPMGTWFANMIINTKNKGETSVEWGAVKAPHFEGQDPNVAVSNPTPIAINKNAAHPEEAWRFVEFMCTEPVSYTHLDVYKRQVMFLTAIFGSVTFLWISFVSI